MGETDIYTMLVVASVVLSILSSAGARGVVADPTVKLSVHYESLCGDSIRFVTKQLYPAWKHFGEDILKVDLNPFGKANVRSLYLVLALPPSPSRRWRTVL